jgi:hypothetical protein
MSARLAARLGRAVPPAACLEGGAAGGGGLPVARLPVGLVAGAGGGGLRPVVGLAIGGLGAPVMPPTISKRMLD